MRKNGLLLHDSVACFTNDDSASVLRRSHCYLESLTWFAPVQTIYLNTDLAYCLLELSTSQLLDITAPLCNPELVFSPSLASISSFRQ